MCVYICVCVRVCVCGCMCVSVCIFYRYMYEYLYFIDVNNVIYVIYCGEKCALFNVIYFLTLFLMINKKCHAHFVHDSTIQDC